MHLILDVNFLKTGQSKLVFVLVFFGVLFGCGVSSYPFTLFTRSSSVLSSDMEPCPTVPHAAIDSMTLLTKLSTRLSDVDRAVAAALQADNSPGGAVLTFVYKDTILWSKGYGLRNMSGMRARLIELFPDGLSNVSESNCPQKVLL